MTKIEWTEKTWNPVVGCSVISPGCTNCYAMKMARRLELMGNAREAATGGDPGPLEHYRGTTRDSRGGAVWTGKVALAPDNILTQPLRWKKPRTVFVNSMGDLFHEDVPYEWIDRVFAVMALCPQHTFQVLTKRADRMRDYASRTNDQWHGNSDLFAVRFNAAMDWNRYWIDDIDDMPWPLPNVWLGVSAENQEQANARIPDLLTTPAAVRFVSVEPMLGPVDLRHVDLDGDFYTNALCPPTASEIWREMYAPGVAGTSLKDAIEAFENDIAPYPPSDVRPPRLNWVICGGESGPDARPISPSDAENLRDQCLSAGVPFFFKQWGEWMPEDYMPDVEAAATYQQDFKAGRTWRFTGEPMRRVGKKRAGRLLDGREWNEMPERSNV